jgi:hypothetical protein
MMQSSSVDVHVANWLKGRKGVLKSSLGDVALALPLASALYDDKLLARTEMTAHDAADTAL